MTLGTFQHEEVEERGQRKLGRNRVAEGRTVDWPLGGPGNRALRGHGDIQTRQPPHVRVKTTMRYHFDH